MDLGAFLLDQLALYGVGRRKLDDKLFSDDLPPPRLGVYDAEDEDLCHEVITSTCSVPGCTFTSESLLTFENHYNSSHRYSCSQCKKVMPSPHLLDLHIQENHDSFFAVLAERKASYCCYIEDCKDKFMNAGERLTHCIKVHKLPKDFRFEQRPKGPKPQKHKKQKKKEDTSMEVDNRTKEKKFSFTNSKQKFAYTGRKFTKNEGEKSGSHVDVDEIMEELKGSLPE